VDTITGTPIVEQMMKQNTVTCTAPNGTASIDNVDRIDTENAVGE